MSIEEKELFILMDDLSEKATGEDRKKGLERDFGELLTECPLCFPSDLPSEAQSNIRKKTFGKLGLKEFDSADKAKATKGGWNLKLWGSIAATIAISLLLGGIIGPGAVWAKLEKAFQYVPGLNLVIEDREKEVDRYVMQGPLERKIAGGTLKIEGVIIDENNAVVELSGKNLPVYDRQDIRFEDAGGGRFYIDSHSTGSTTGEWKGTFVHRGFIERWRGLKLIVPDGISIKLPLVEARKYASYEEMGPTDVENDISITAVTSVEKGKIRVNLVSPPLEGMHMESYGVEPHSGQLQLTLKDSGGKSYPPSHDNSHMGSLSEFYFNINAETIAGMKLSIPMVGVYVQDTANMTFWLPLKGEKQINKKVELAGFPVTFEKVRRIGKDKVEIDVNVGYDPKAQESLYMFRLDGRSYGAHYEKGGALVRFELEVKPYQYWISLDLADPVVYKKGPWEIELGKTKE